jgi:hypothetical protein
MRLGVTPARDYDRRASDFIKSGAVGKKAQRPKADRRARGGVLQNARRDAAKRRSAHESEREPRLNDTRLVGPSKDVTCAPEFLNDDNRSMKRERP